MTREEWTRICIRAAGSYQQWQDSTDQPARVRKVLKEASDKALEPVINEMAYRQAVIEISNAVQLGELEVEAVDDEEE